MPGLNTDRDRWRQFAVTIIYAVSVWLFQYVTIPHYALLSGLHFSVLLLVPYRLWPALFCGDVLAQIPTAIECAGSFGWLWSAFLLVPGTLFSGPIIYFFRERNWLFVRDGSVRIGNLLACALIVALVMMGVNEVQLSTVVYQPGVRHASYEHLAVQWVLGNLLGILTVVPTVLALRQLGTGSRLRERLAALIGHRAVFESVCVTVPILGALLWVGFTDVHLRGVAQFLMFIPVVYLSLRHGWVGAALGCAFASVALAWLMPAAFDHATIRAESVLAFATATMLLAGVRIETLDRRAEKERHEVQLALALAHRNAHLGELQLRMTAQALEQVRETIRATFMMMMGRLRHLQPAVDDGGYRRAALSVEEQLSGIADSLQPGLPSRQGLPNALEDGLWHACFGVPVLSIGVICEGQ